MKLRSRPGSRISAVFAPFALMKCGIRHTESLVARASTDWVYLDHDTLRPVTIPQAMQLAFFPEGVPEKSLSRERFPKHPAPGDDIPVLRKVVVWDDLDMMWHVNNATYMNYMDQAEKHALAARGWSMRTVPPTRYAYLYTAAAHRISASCSFG